MSIIVYIVCFATLIAYNYVHLKQNMSLLSNSSSFSCSYLRILFRVLSLFKLCFKEILQNKTCFRCIMFTGVIISCKMQMNMQNTM